MESQKDNSKSISFKIHFGDNNIRRFKLESRLNYDSFVEFMHKLYAPNYHPELRFQYIDSEGDKIDVTSDMEWQEMFEEMKGRSPIHLYIVEPKHAQYFKDGPPPCPLYFYTNQNDKKPVNDPTLDDLKALVPQCIAELFPGKKVLPHNIPSWLDGILNVTNLSNNEVDIDVDVVQLGHTIERRALDLLNAKDFTAARNLFKSLSIIAPMDCSVVYNLACSESLLGNCDEALKQLGNAVRLGFKNLKHILQDEDLKNIMNTDLFKEIVKNLESSSQPNEPVQKEPEVVPQSLQKEPEPQPKEPEPQPAPKEPEPQPPANYKWEAELKVLHEMGFYNDSYMIAILEESQDLERVIIHLLEL